MIPRERALVPREDLTPLPVPSRCFHCGGQTLYGDLGFVAPLCPWPCYHEAWAAYCKAAAR